MQLDLRSTGQRGKFRQSQPCGILAATEFHISGGKPDIGTVSLPIRTIPLGQVCTEIRVIILHALAIDGVRIARRNQYLIRIGKIGRAAQAEAVGTIEGLTASGKILEVLIEEVSGLVGSRVGRNGSRSPLGIEKRLLIRRRLAAELQ